MKENITTAVRVVRLPNGKRVTLAEYLRSWKALRSMEEGAAVSGFSYRTETASSVRRELRKGIDERINQHLPGYGVGRKWDSDWQRWATITAIQVNTPRRIVRPSEVPFSLRKRLAHRLTQNWEL